MSFHDEWLEKIKDFKAAMLAETGKELNLPAPTLIELRLEYLDMVPGEKISARFPFQEKFSNSLGSVQGGFLAAAMDEVFGPLSYSTANRPCTTVSMNMTYLKPFTKALGSTIIEATVIQKTRTMVFLRGTIRSEDGTLLTTAETHLVILQRQA